jgi:hypothetical protein
MDEPPRMLQELAQRHKLAPQVRILEEGVPHLF